ncbi:MAG: hypothetical protein M1831_006263 [Alyxoria varia]|nr:MAG: hypothetical protein M1831_006263 [Alyxoria varia]
MNKDLQDSLNTLETHLNSLLDSITSYNPSTNAASSLVAADSAFSSSLQTLAQHQRNHQRLQALRTTSDDLDQQIKDFLRRLAEGRKELLNAAPVVGKKSAALGGERKGRNVEKPWLSTGDDDEEAKVRSVDAKTLLDYSRRISRFTVPPTYRPPLPPPIDGEQDDGNIEKNDDSQTAAEGDGAGTSPMAIDGNGTQNTAQPPTQASQPGSPAQADQAPPSDQQQAQNGPNAQQSGTCSRLTPQMLAWLSPYDPSSGNPPPFIPWPDEMTIKRGALGKIHALVESGQDPNALADEGGEGAGAMEEDMGEDGQQAAAEQREEDHQVPIAAPATASTRPAAPPQPVEFEGFDLYDPDND